MSEAGPPAPPVPPGRGAPAGRGGKRRGGTAGDMVRSMVVIVALVVVVYVAVPRPQGRIEQPVDVGTTVAQASDVGIAVDAPRVPDGWTANVATFEADPVEGLPTLTLNWVLPNGTFVGVRATRGATPAWTGSATGSGRPSGDDAAPVTLEGRDWQALDGTAGDTVVRSLVLDGEGTAEGVTYVVTGTGPEADLERVATEVVPG